MMMVNIYRTFTPVTYVYPPTDSSNRPVVWGGPGGVGGWGVGRGCEWGGEERACSVFLFIWCIPEKMGRDITKQRDTHQVNQACGR